MASYYVQKKKIRKGEREKTVRPSETEQIIMRKRKVWLEENSQGAGEGKL